MALLDDDDLPAAKPVNKVGPRSVYIDAAPAATERSSGKPFRRMAAIGVASTLVAALVVGGGYYGIRSFQDAQQAAEAARQVQLEAKLKTEAEAVKIKAEQAAVLAAKAKVDEEAKASESQFVQVKAAEEVKVAAKQETTTATITQPPSSPVKAAPVRQATQRPAAAPNYDALLRGDEAPKQQQSKAVAAQDDSQQMARIKALRQQFQNQ